MAKKLKSLKNITKSNKKKLSIKNLDFKKNWKKLSYLGLAGFLALSSVGYGVWKNIDSNKASAYTPLATINGVRFSGCKFTETQYAQKQVRARLQMYNSQNTQAIYSRPYSYSTKTTIPPYGVRVANDWGSAYSEFSSTRTLSTSFKVERGSISTLSVVSYSFGSLPWC